MGYEDFYAGKHGLITGGSSGIGLAVAEQLVRARARVTLIARREGLLLEAKQHLEAKVPGAQVRCLAVDVGDSDALRAVLEPVLQEDPVDILVNNAGISRPGRFLEIEAAWFEKLMTVNYLGVVNLCRLVAPTMVQRRRGWICNVSSLAGVIGIYGHSAYAASKFAVVGFSQCLRAELAPAKVHVSLCLPPDTDTPMLRTEGALQPPETKAISASASVLSADEVATQMLKGIARGDFEIVPGLSAHVLYRLSAALPGLARFVMDQLQARARS